MVEAAPAPSLAASALLNGEADSRRARELDRWRRHSLRVRRLRRWLPYTMIALVLLLGVWIGYRAIVTWLNTSNGALGDIHMLDPEFHGRNDRGRPFVLSAKEAIRDGHDLNKVTLIRPALRIENEDGSTIRLNGLHGLYRDDTKVLNLDGDVNLDDGKGAHFHSDLATIDTNADTASGNSRVSGDSPLGHTEASSYAILNRGAHLIFRGQVRSRIINDRGASR
ncbi:MAG: LPS export ABC transporter periplasmic protein LptC [Pseudomonadota bacterium]|jgi:lipopolysaccharide export system protein LptC